MLSRINTARFRKNPTFVFWSVFMLVLLVTVVIVTAITFMPPDTYASTTIIKLEPYGREVTSARDRQLYDDLDFLRPAFEMIQSPVVLSNVVSALNLNVVWGKKYYGGEVLKTTECMDILKRRMDLKAIPNTKLIAITVYGDDRYECAALANAIAQSYEDYRVALLRDKESKSRAVLQAHYRERELKIDQLQADTDALAKKYDVHQPAGPYWDKKTNWQTPSNFAAPSRTSWQRSK